MNHDVTEVMDGAGRTVSAWCSCGATGDPLEMSRHGEAADEVKALEAKVAVAEMRRDVEKALIAARHAGRDETLTEIDEMLRGMWQKAKDDLKWERDAKKPDWDEEAIKTLETTKTVLVNVMGRMKMLREGRGP